MPTPTAPMVNKLPMANKLLALIVLSTLLAALLALTPAPRAAAEGPDGVSDYVTDYAATNGLPGVAVAVVKDGEIIQETATGEGVTPRTPMAIASVSKMITAFAVLQLVDSEQIGLDETVVTHLPDFAMDDPRAADITVRHLLSHTSGMPNPMLVPPAGSPADRVAQLDTFQLSSDPGTRYAYSNFNYQTAARLLEVVSGQGYGEYLADQVFGPVGMQDTRATPDGPGMADGHVTAYGTAIPLPEMVAMNVGSGSVISTAHDMGLWLGMLQRGGVTADGTRLLSAELLARAQQAQPGAPHNGLGWEHTQTAVPARIGHSGTLTRYSSRVDLVPDSGYGAAVLLNSYTTTFDHPFAISTGIIDLTEGTTPEVGAPVATIIDGVLGLLTVGVAALGVRAVIVARRWVERRRDKPLWRFVVRQLPHAIVPAAAIALFGVLPTVDDNSATPLDAFGLWPAATILLLVGAAAGAAIIIARTTHRISGSRTAD